MNRRTLVVRLVGMLALLATAHTGAATPDTFPSRPIKLLVGYPPGGVPDVIARQVARKLGEQFQVSVVVENRAGAGGVIAAEALAKAPPDGYTLFLGDTGHWAINPHLFATLPYDPMKAFMPVGRVATSFSTLVISSTVPATTLPEFLTYLKQNPGKVHYASYGVGSISHLTAELFKTTAGAEIVHVPYKGAAPAVQALMAGDVQMGFVSYTAAQQGMAAGKLRILGVGSPQRSPNFPDIPTLSEGLPGFEMLITYGFVAPIGTPPATVDALNAALNAAVSAPEVIQSFNASAVTAAPTSAAQFQSIMAAEFDKFGRLVKQSGARMD